LTPDTPERATIGYAALGDFHAVLGTFGSSTPASFARRMARTCHQANGAEHRAQNTQSQRHGLTQETSRATRT
jgi:hypothetical protein